MNQEQLRITDDAWYQWGPYLSDRQWGTVREDYSHDGNAWNYTTHDMARSFAYRWGEEGIAGISDKEQFICFAIALWNKKDPILKERYFGLSNEEGNHGEDVKELYYYLDNTPSHAYMKALYKYPQQAFPYQQLVEENKKRTRYEPEFELVDTGVFSGNKYFDVFIEYAKAAAEDILVRITVHNRSNEDALLHVLPTIWFRNTWAYETGGHKPELEAGDGVVKLYHPEAGHWQLNFEGDPEIVVCDNETNTNRLYHAQNENMFYKDGINDYIVHGKDSINPARKGTKAAGNYDIMVKAQQCVVLRLRLCNDTTSFEDFDEIFEIRLKEADAFYAAVQGCNENADALLVQRQAFAGMLWNKQFYYYDVNRWIEGDADRPAPAKERLKGRNHGWKHMYCKEIISMPDKWEFPWFASWDLAFHCLPLALIDAGFAKSQLLLFTKTWYMHANGHLPAYEWDFSDVNPPVHAMATWLVYALDKKNNNGKGDLLFLEKIFHKLMLNFTWWVNRKDAEGSNIFEGGFMGLDNIGVFDRNMRLPSGVRLEQADTSSWMAMYSLNLLRIAVELGKQNSAFEDIGAKFFEHFLSIVATLRGSNGSEDNLWNDEDGFYYDRLRFADGTSLPLKVRSVIGLIPLFAVEVLDETAVINHAGFEKRVNWICANRPGLSNLVLQWKEKNDAGKLLVSLVRGQQLKKILSRVFDENEFLSDYGIRSLSKYHLENPYSFNSGADTATIQYIPGESDTSIYGGNSNWRGPVWLPINFLLIESLRLYHSWYGNDFTIEFPTRSGNYVNLQQAADELGKRVAAIFLQEANGKRAFLGDDEKLQQDPYFSNLVLFNEYFHGDSGKGLGASHQTGWTGLIIRYLFNRTMHL